MLEASPLSLDRLGFGGRLCGGRCGRRPGQQSPVAAPLGNSLFTFPMKSCLVAIDSGHFALLIAAKVDGWIDTVAQNVTPSRRRNFKHSTSRDRRARLLKIPLNRGGTFLSAGEASRSRTLKRSQWRWSTRAGNTTGKLVIILRSKFGTGLYFLQAGGGARERRDKFLPQV